MKDMLSIIYASMTANEVIKQECGERIGYYIYSETADTSGPFLTIRPLQPPVATTYASNQNLGMVFHYQIDVQSSDRMKCKEIQQAVKEVMESLGFAQQSGGLDEYFEETGRFVDARRYLGNMQIYDTDY